MWSKVEICLISLAALAFISVAHPQETPVTSSPTASPPRTVRFTFVPPPLEGTLSLGIYNPAGKLVRVLHQEAELDEFTVAADGLATEWDGKSDDGADLPAGKYRARGYAVGHCKIEDIGSAPHGWPADAADRLTIKLVRNALSKKTSATVDLAVSCDDENCFLKTADDLPLLTVSDRTDVWRVALAKRSDTTVDLFQDDGDTVDQLRVSNVNQMMAFDCGEIELK